MRMGVKYKLWALLAIAGASQASETTDMLAAHNAVRARAGVPPLVWSGRLAAHAQSWAETLLAANKFVHNPKSPYGENLFEASGAQLPARQVVDQWDAEARDY